ncbi:hypothetical protein GCM10007103_25660 [Salinimicrobium marinum]|uniref:LVIVD repeat-containing protein n=1 Tax=Salinimicrobium marinum TaxID=680283 RepID=A0A918SJC7_9FLAO|nr:hypothetical protein [Salinimicrobium marinum]GHA43250.1 hypothetical protein GCM10007103_25660 [Salinimicrobium marinum]
MKKNLFAIIMLFLLQSCWYNEVEDDFVRMDAYQPITQSRADFEKTMELTAERQVVNSGKIYIKDELIYLNEKGEGFHIIDNSDPENPKPLAFLRIPLSTDLAIRNNTIYVHHAVDLVAFNYSVVNNSLNILHREKNVFPALRSPEGWDAENYEIPEDHIVIGYEEVN